MSLWNAANGPSVHAELVGRELIKMGYELIVFSSIEHPDARPTNQIDEEYVIRHFAVDTVNPITKAYYFDPTPLIEREYDIFIAENVERLPTMELYQLFPLIKRKAKTIMVVHEGGPSKDPNYYRFDWDAIVCFDKRYLSFIREYFPGDKIHIIPYPCYPYTPGDKKKAREELGLPLNEKIIFSYGFRPGDITKILPPIVKLSKIYPLRYIIFVNPESEYNELIRAKDEHEYEFLDIKISALPFDLLYKYLYASDALLFYRESSPYNAVLSSSVCLTLGSGCPILFNESNYVKMHGNEIIKYKDVDDMKQKLIDVFEGKFNNKYQSLVAEYLRRRDSRAVAKKFADLFNEIYGREGEGVIRH